MSKTALPALWIIVFMVGLPQLAETVYTLSLPDIAHSFQASEPMAEYTFTTYLFGFALGTLFWGKISDTKGRKPCVISGLIMFIIGSLMCYLAPTIEMMMLARFIQAFGGSTGSVLGQAICRDAFQDSSLGKIYAAIGTVLAIFPALGPLVGNLITNNFHWSYIFLFLALFGLILTLLIAWYLPETLVPEKRVSASILKIALSLIKNKKVIGFSLIIGITNGIAFSYFAEGSFYLIKGLDLPTYEYSLSFLGLAAAMMLGGIITRKMHNYYKTETILAYSLLIIFIASLIFSFFITLNLIIPLSRILLIVIVLVSMMIIMFGICIATSTGLTLALRDYQDNLGTATSLVGFFYYGLMSLCTFGMGLLHDGTLLPMPLYFLVLSGFALFIQCSLNKLKQAAHS